MVGAKSEPYGNFYYELADYIAKEYFDDYRYYTSPHKWVRRSLMYQSTRVWLENNGEVTYLKNRYESPESAKVDMKEFMWIKLKAKEI